MSLLKWLYNKKFSVGWILNMEPGMIHRMGYLVTLSLGTRPRIFIVRTVITHRIENIFLMWMLEVHLHGECVCTMPNIKIWRKGNGNIQSVTWLSTDVNRWFLSSSRYLKMLIIRMMLDNTILHHHRVVILAPSLFTQSRDADY